MTAPSVEIVIPEECRKYDQNEEWVKFIRDGKARRVRLHDYAKFFEIPGLYDRFYENLKCHSPGVVCEALKRQLNMQGCNGEKRRVLDFGAGNGQVGESIQRKLDCDVVVGLDIISEARDAALRDRPDIYDDYYVMDMAEPDARDIEKLAGWKFNTLVTVAAMGFGDICTRAFANAYNLLDEGGWVAFNIKDRFMSETDNTGFFRTINKLMDDGFELLESHRYRHRLSLAGDPLYYYVIVGRKIRNIAMS